LETIAQYCPLIPHIDITNCGSLAEVWQVIRLHSNIETSGALLNNVWNISRQPDETPQSLWSRLKQHYDDALIRKESLKYKDKALTVDEVMSPTLHNVIILHWLQIIHPKLRDMVTQRFSKELRDSTYASIWPEISRSIDTFLKDLSDEDSTIRRYDPTTSYNKSRYPESTRSPWRGRGFTPRPRGAPPQRSQATKQCDYCRITGRRAWYNHSIDECLFLKQERPATSNAVEVEDYEEDEHYTEFYHEYPPDPPAQIKPVHIINRVFTHPSPVLPLFHSDRSYQLTLDTGGTCNVLDSATATELRCKVRPTDQRARMADGRTSLEVLGETEVVFNRNKQTFTFSALVCSISEPTILAGMPFLSEHDIAIRPAKSEIILNGSESIIYDRKPAYQPMSRRMSSYTIRSPSTTVILPGETASFQLPGHLSKENTVTVEPRFDNNYQKSLTYPWPCPKVYSVIDGEITIPNTSSDPIPIKKNQHVCNIQLEVPSDISRAIVEKAVSSVPSSSHPAKKTTPYSTPVKLNPDGVLTSEETAKFNSLLQQYDEVFNPKISRYNQKSGQCFVEVNMGPNPPPQHKGRVPFYGRNNLVELQEKFDVLVDKGVFQRPQDIGVTVENLNTTFLVKKRDSEDKRMVTDFASIADYCRPTPTLMPDVDSTLRQIATWKYLIITDFTEAFFQLPLKKSSMRYCGVVTPMRGVLVYTVGCMGLPGTEVALEELTSLLFGHMVMKGQVAKLADDLFIGGATPEELHSNFEEVLGILLENNLKLSAKKTSVAPKSVGILGWVWTDGYLKASPHKLSALTECDLPKTTKALKSYIGAYRFLSRVVKDYATVLLPLESMIPGKYSSKAAGNTKVDWSPEQIEAFHKAQTTLKAAKSIALPQPDDVLQIVTDAAVQPTAIGATLYLIRGKKTLLGGFFNAKLPTFQRRWLPCELEGVAIGVALSHYAPFILQSRKRPVVLTDSKACVDAVEKLNRGEFSASSRLCTFLSAASRYRAIVKHIQGNNNIVSDYISRNPVECKDLKCQICSFLKQSIESVVSTVTISDVLEGKVNLPFINKKSWIEIQNDCPDLRNVYKFLRNGTSPGKKGRNLRQVKQYIRSKVIISAEGTLVVHQIEPFLPQSERIVVPQTVLHGILTVLHIKLNHPSRYQLMKAFNRYFFALKLEPAAARTSDSCHQCVSLKDIPKAMNKESSEEAPDYLTHKCAADVIKRNSQLILVLRESVSSYTQTQLIPNETAECIATSLLSLANLIRPSAITPMIIRADPHPSHKALFNNKQSLLSTNNILLEIGRELNVNHNPVAEKAVREMIKEILTIQPNGGPISSSTLSQATANLNSRIRSPGVSAHEIFTQRDQTTGKQLSFDDIQIISDQHKRRLYNHTVSEKCKSGGKPEHPMAKVSVGSIVYIYNDGSKLQARPRYVVLSVKDGWCGLRRFADKRLGHITYSAKLSECYLIPTEIATDDNLPPYPDYDESDYEFLLPTASTKPTHATHIRPEEEDSNSGGESSEDSDEAATSDSDHDVQQEISYCAVCHRQVNEDHHALICDQCTQWSHRSVTSARSGVIETV
jgi:hypothetical protein